MRKLLLAVALVALCAVATPALAQDQTIEITEADMDRFVDLMRTDVANDRASLVGYAMEFTAEESAAFWPLYTEYERGLKEFGQMRWQLIKDFAESYQDMSDDVAAELIQRSFAGREQRFKMQADFVAKLASEMGPKIAARFVQVDNQLTNLLDLQVAQMLPLVKKPQQ